MKPFSPPSPPLIKKQKVGYDIEYRKIFFIILRNCLSQLIRLDSEAMYLTVN
jgi:hypothetical protein